MLTDSEVDLAFQYFREGYSEKKVVRLLNTSFYDLRIATAAKPELRQYAIASRHAEKPWDNTDPKIQRARQRYDFGDSELVTGRNGMIQVLYEIPRKNPASDRSPYFARIEGEET